MPFPHDRTIYTTIELRGGGEDGKRDLLFRGTLKAKDLAQILQTLANKAHTKRVDNQVP
jgi:hypothetical protein